MPDPTQPPPRILLVDDHPELRQGLSRYLRYQGYEVVEAPDGRTAIEALEVGPPFSVLLTDLSLPDLDGRDVAREAKRVTPTTWTVIITGWDVDDDDVRPWGVERIFRKPVDLGELCGELALRSAPGGNPA